MKPNLFVPSVLALAVALGALTFANVVTQGFSAEGCRFGADGVRWSAAGEFLLVQGLLFGVPTAVLVTLLYRVIAARLTAVGKSRVAASAMAWCFGAAFVMVLLASLHFIANCGARTGMLATLTAVATAFRFLGPITAMFGVIALVAGLVQGMSGRSRDG